MPEHVAYLEIITENFLGSAPVPRKNLARLAARYPVVLHGVGLNLLGEAPLDQAYLDAVRRLADSIDAVFVTDHLCWTGAGGSAHHDLLPFPFTEDVVGFAAERAATVQKLLGRPFGLENVSSYVTFAASTMSEAELTVRVVRDAGCHLLLDINNVVVSSHNHGLDPGRWLDWIDFSRVLQVHLAGYDPQPDGIWVDTHDRPSSDETLALYAAAWEKGGPFPTLFEWDARIPPLPVVARELGRAIAVRG